MLSWPGFFLMEPVKWCLLNGFATVDNIMTLIIVLQTANRKIVDRISIALSHLILILIRDLHISVDACAGGSQVIQPMKRYLHWLGLQLCIM